MAAFVKFEAFTEHLAEKVHNLGADALTIALSNDAPSASLDAVLADLTSQVSYANCSARVPTISGSVQTGGVYKLTLADLVLTASGGSVGPFRYIILYNDTPTSPADPLIGYYDYGSSITLLTGETLTINFDDANGVLTIT